MEIQETLEKQINTGELSDQDLENVVAGKGTSQQAVIAGKGGAIAQQGRGKQQAVIGGRRR
jgi:hypothetical protein